MDLHLKDKAVIITGGSSGIGAELAFAFAQEGCKVSVCGRSKVKMDRLKDKFSHYGFELISKVVDVQDLQQLQQYIEEVSNSFGKLDILINNAGITIRKPFDQLTEDDFLSLVNTNFRATYFASAYASKQMRKYSNGGVILNTSSFVSIIPAAGIALYSSLKAAVDKLTAVLAAELAADNIRVVSIQPGITITPMTKENCESNYEHFVNMIAMNRLALPEDIIGAYLFLASDKASYINGVSLPITGAKLTVQNPHYSYGDKKSNY